MDLFDLFSSRARARFLNVTEIMSASEAFLSESQGTAPQPTDGATEPHSYEQVGLHGIRLLLSSAKTHIAYLHHPAAWQRQA